MQQLKTRVPRLQHKTKISVIVPVYNEEKSLDELFERLQESLLPLSVPYEIIAVDDGSRDNSFRVLIQHARRDPHIVPLRLKRNYGQTAALAAGIERASGEVLITIDSDLENDPADIPKLYEKIEEGYDVVSGWRQDRWRGAYIKRKLPSLFANKLISLFTGVHLHDYGCTLKAYRAENIKNVPLYGDMHRFVAAYAAWQGGAVTEIPVSYAPRKYGTSNYGMGRVLRVLLDLVVVLFMHRYMNRPMHFFGGWGFLSLCIGFAAGIAAFILKMAHIRSFVSTPLPTFSALFIIVGVQLIMFGVIGEMLMRTYYESQGRRPYSIREP